MAVRAKHYRFAVDQGAFDRQLADRLRDLRKPVVEIRATLTRLGGVSEAGMADLVMKIVDCVRVRDQKIIASYPYPTHSLSGRHPRPRE